MHASRCVRVYERVFLRAFVFPLTRLKSLTEVPSCWSLRCFSLRANFSRRHAVSSRARRMNHQTLPFLSASWCLFACQPVWTESYDNFFFFFLPPPMICRTTGSLSHWSCVDTKGCRDLVRSVYTSRSTVSSASSMRSVVNKIKHSQATYVFESLIQNRSFSMTLIPDPTLSDRRQTTCSLWLQRESCCYSDILEMGLNTFSSSHVMPISAE